MSEADDVRRALPNYEIGAVLGRGAWAAVFAARHRQLDRPVAVKLLEPGVSADPAVRARFLTEARLLASLDHPGVVRVHDFVEVDELCLLVMEYLGGGTLGRRFIAGEVRPEEAVAVTTAACAGVAHAHSRGVLHRDIKPENLMFAGSGELKVTDFGIAKVIGGARTALTAAGYSLGTPAYMAPEQIRGTTLGPSTDVYALGMVLYELLAGQLPFDVDGEIAAVLYRRVHERPVPLVSVAPSIPAAVADVVMRAIATDPADRIQTADELGDALVAAGSLSWGTGWLRDAAASDTRATVDSPADKVAPRHTPVSSARLRRPVVLGAVVSSVAVLAVTVALLAVANDGDPNGGDGRTELSQTTLTPAGAVTSTEAALFDRAGEVADALFDAWKRGDRNAARAAAGGVVAEQLFARRYEELMPRRVDRCSPHSSTEIDCIYGYSGGQMVLLVDVSGGEPRVVEVEYIDD